MRTCCGSHDKYAPRKPLYRISRDHPERGFYTLLLQLLSYGTILAVKRQTRCGTASTCRQSVTHLYVHMVTQDTAVTRQTPAAKSHPFESNTLHLLPVEQLRNLVATHPAAVAVEWSNHVWNPFLPVFLVNRQASLSASSLSLLKSMCTRSICLLWVFYIESYDCSTNGRHTGSSSPVSRHRFFRYLRWVLAYSATPLTWTQQRHVHRYIMCQPGP